MTRIRQDHTRDTRDGRTEEWNSLVSHIDFKYGATLPFGRENPKGQLLETWIKKTGNYH